jgi:hypothetical protein
MNVSTLSRSSVIRFVDVMCWSFQYCKVHCTSAPKWNQKMVCFCLVSVISMIWADQDPQVHTVTP